jgi:formylglycine-generating enzyme required for sulfatase activity
MKKVFMLFLLACIAGNSYANNISIQKVAITDTNRTAKTASIRFNISWDNSWRDEVNWDAAWIFVKFRRPQDSVWRYKHMTLSSSNNSVGSGTANMKFAIPDDRKGAFYYRSGIGSGDIKMDSVKLFWNYAADSVSVIDSVEVKVFATEMVYVPEGNFALGDGNGTQKSSYSFQLKNAPNNFVTVTDKWSPPINIMVNINDNGIDDAILHKDGIRISGLGGLDITNDKVADLPDFPTGYRAFYCMKYPVTQGQYTDMLNTISSRDTVFQWMQYNDTSRLKKVNSKYKAVLQNLDPFYNSIPNDLQRHTISLDSNEVKYFVSRPDRAYGRGQTNHYEAYSDWAALRPITELEFEKAARGPLPPMYKVYRQNNNYNYNSDTTNNWSGFDWAWGNDSTIARSQNMLNSQFTFSGPENGTEFFSNYNIFKRYNNPTMYGTTGGDGGSGPYRVGIFATDTSSRISSGATYYGIMDFSKNVAQLVVSVGSSKTRTLSFKKHGDGMLNYYGQADQNEFFIQNNNGPMGNSGSQFITKQYATSERQQNWSSNSGFRSVRTAPAEN